AAFSLAAPGLARATTHASATLATAAPASAKRRAPATSAGRASPGDPSGARTRSDNRRGHVARAPRNAPIELYSVNSKESLVLRLRDDRGRPVRGVQKRFDHLLRCHNTNVQHPMNPRLVRLLYQIGKHYPGRRIEVVSGYRHPTVAKNPHSPHMQG